MNDPRSAAGKSRLARAAHDRTDPPRPDAALGTETPCSVRLNMKSEDFCAVCGANLRLVGARHRCVGNGQVTPKPVSQSESNKPEPALTAYQQQHWRSAKRHIAPI